MGKLESNKQQKRTSLLDTAFKLFTTQGVSKTSIAEISQKAGIAKGIYGEDRYLLGLHLKDLMKEVMETKVNIMLELHLMLVKHYLKLEEELCGIVQDHQGYGVM